jgi:uncharacterized membrane protein
MLIEKKIFTASRFDVRKITLIGMLSAISIVLGLTPLGFIPIPPVKATIMHIPVIIGAIIGGPLVGSMVGLIFGIFSIVQAIINPLPTSFVFLNPLVSVLPRVIIGITSYYAYCIFKTKSQILRIGFSAFIGSITNTIGVLGAIYLIYLQSYAKAINLSTTATSIAILGVGFSNGLPEAIISVLICIPVIQIAKKMRK